MHAVKNTSNIQEIWSLLIAIAAFKKQRNLFAPLLGHPIWWLGTLKQQQGQWSMMVDPRTNEIWSDPRLNMWRSKTSVLNRIAQLKKTDIPFDIKLNNNKEHTHCIPVLSNGKTHYFLCLSNIKENHHYKSNLPILHTNLKTFATCAIDTAEKKRLSDSLRPRMVALSTIHTIHRLINTTANINELYEKLARLTAQVMRARSCSIIMLDKTKTGKRLLEVGNSNSNAISRTKKKIYALNSSIEGQVFHSAKAFLRKQFMCAPLIDEDVIGVISLHGKKDPNGFNFLDQEIIMTLAEEAVVAIKNAQLYEEQHQLTLETIQSLAYILGARFAHHRKIDPNALIQIAELVGKRLHLNDDELKAIHYATLLRDAGKIGLPDAILKKTAELTGEEFALVRQQPVKGALMVESFRHLKPVAPILLFSHENYDGSGYPNGLKKDEIPLGSRILAVLNAFDALIAERPYRQRSTIQEALEELERSSGTQFDPQVVQAFKDVIATKQGLHILNHHTNSKK